MKNNVITHSHMVPFGRTGSLEIIGYQNSNDGFNKGTVAFIAKSDELDYLRPSQPDFCKTTIITWALDGSDTVVFVFTINIRGQLRNPQKLLKSVRNKLMGAIHTAEQSIEHETEEEVNLNDLSFWGAWRR